MHIDVRLQCVATLSGNRAAALQRRAEDVILACDCGTHHLVYTRTESSTFGDVCQFTRMKMYAWKLLFMSCVFIPLTYQGVAGDAESSDKSEEMSKSEDDTASVEVGTDAAGRNQSEPMGPPDSHEAMNNRELKPKLTIGDRRKRSYEFLVGLVKRNASVYEVTKHGRTAAPPSPPTDADVKASEVLLELLVKIAANPRQWTSVHELLRKIDADLLKSKELVDNLKASAIVRDDVTSVARRKAVALQAAAIASSGAVVEQQPSPKPSHAPPPPYQQNFAYHRVTGNPLPHSPSNSKSTKAYIAVSVIAPKAPRDAATVAEDELALENELRELKPWSHRQNLKNMADIRSRWVIQTAKAP